MAQQRWGTARTCMYCGKECGPEGYHPECIPDDLFGTGGPRTTAKETQPSSPISERVAVRQAVPAPRGSDVALGGTPGVRVTDLDIPFGRLVTILLKLSLAAIPALVVINVVFVALLALIYWFVPLPIR